jgi:hypothetical protein
VCSHGNANSFGNLFPRGSFTQKLDVFFPRKRDQNAHAGRSTTIKKPAWRRMVNPHNIQTSLAHETEIDIDLLRPPKIVSVVVRFERTVSDTLNKELSVTLEKEFRSRPNSRIRNRHHVVRSRDICQYFLGFNQEIPPSLRIKLRRSKQLAWNDKIEMLPNQKEDRQRLRGPKKPRAAPAQLDIRRDYVALQLRDWNF